MYEPYFEREEKDLNDENKRAGSAKILERNISVVSSRSTLQKKSCEGKGRELQKNLSEQVEENRLTGRIECEERPGATTAKSLRNAGFENVTSPKFPA
jgi:hypothetical protein